MKIFILSILSVAVLGCTVDLPSIEIDKAEKLCAQNDGVKKMNVGYTFMPHVFCNNGAEFWLSNK